MSWRGTVRSLNAAANRMERDARGRQRELEREEKQYQKMLELEQAAYDVEVFNNHIELITSVHKDCSAVVDWQGIINSPAPIAPIPSDPRTEEAQTKLDNYSPGFFDKLFGRVEKAKARLESRFKEAVNNDKAENIKALREHEVALEEWGNDKMFAKQVLNFEWPSWEDAIKEVQPLAEIGEIAKHANIELMDDHSICVQLKVHGEDIVPSEQVSLLQSGCASYKKMPIGKFYEIYQDCVAACAIRCAREMFALFPIDKVVVTCTDDLLDTATGNIEEQPILSVDFRRETFDTMNFERIDPSDSLKNFNHNMSFLKTKGFKPVEILE